MVRPVGQVEYAPSPMHESARGGSGRVDGFVKRAMDVLFSAGALVAFLPVMIPIAMLIKLEDGGPILFGHRRQTRGGQTFRCWKFRTMLPNAYLATYTRYERYWSFWRYLGHSVCPPIWLTVCFSRAATFPKRASIQSASHNQIAPRFKAAIAASAASGVGRIPAYNTIAAQSAADLLMLICFTLSTAPGQVSRGSVH